MAIIQEQKAAAKALGVSDRQLRTWQAIPGFPDHSRGYNIQAINEWVEQHQRKGSQSDYQMQMINKGLKLAQTGLINRRIKEADDKNSVREAELLPRRLYEGFIANLLAGVADWCDQLPALIEAELPKKHAGRIKTRLATELRRMRDQLAEDLKQKPTADGA